MQFLVFQTLLYGKTLRKDVASQSAPPTTGRSQDPWRRNDFLSMFHEVTLSQATLASPPPHLQCPQGSQDQGPPWPVYPCQLGCISTDNEDENNESSYVSQDLPHRTRGTRCSLCLHSRSRWTGPILPPEPTNPVMWPRRPASSPVIF
ncbi:uncharacterized protein LOC123626420 isoform X4 [Lemur catta]|uniref:uncharacterized protein LOC123626420 isoform X4 n=1 Tax=Lemur catta TaxID=9447 RepID=UPI001E268F9E|nr:uncharacterized protein LOC123626420 isoform X4 [Lemur catta]